MTSSTLPVNMRRALSGRPLAMLGLVTALLLGAPLHAGAVFTNPDPADDYTTPFLYEALIDPPAEYGVPAFATAPDGDIWAFHRDGLEESDNLMAVYDPGSSAASSTMPMPGRWLSSMAFGEDGLLYGTDLTSTGETQSVVAFDPQNREYQYPWKRAIIESYGIKN